MEAISRRSFGAWLGAGGVLFVAPWLEGCGQYPAEEGEAYAPWDFPGDETRPERVAVAAALLAASPHNTQPWRFAIRETGIDVYFATERRLGAVDALGREQHIGLGCAIENLMLAAEAHGRSPTLSWLPSPAAPEHVAHIELTESAPKTPPLYHAIAHRHTNRGAYLDGKPPGDLEPALGALVDDADVELTFLGTPEAKSRFRQGTIAAAHAIVDDQEMWNASHRWWRQTKADIEAYRDGMTIDAMGFGDGLRVLAKLTGAPSAAKAAEYWLDRTEHEQTTGFAFVLLSTTDRASRQQQLRLGRIFQRIHLWTTSQGLALQPLNQLPERQDREEQLSLAPRFGPLLAELSGRANSTVQMCFRIGVEWDPAKKSPRRPLGWVVQ